MKFQDFLHWRQQRVPRAILNEDLEEFVDLEKLDAFRKYRAMVEWRIHNVAEQLLKHPKDQQYFAGYVDGLRLILQDFRKIKEMARKRKD